MRVDHSNFLEWFLRVLLDAEVASYINALREDLITQEMADRLIIKSIERHEKRISKYAQRGVA